MHSRIVAAILLNWRNAKDTIAAVESILRSSICSRIQIIVCDNDSNDNSAEAFLGWASRNPAVAADRIITAQDDFEAIRTSFKKQVVWIATGANLGFAGGNNVGVRIAQKIGGFDYFWFLNNDCTVEPETLPALIAAVESDPTIGICGALLRYVTPDDRIQAYGGARHNIWSGRARYVGHWAQLDTPHSAAEVEQQLSYVCGASIFVRRDFIEKVGLMAEDYFLYFEELDWAVRAKRAGFRLAYCPSAIVHHKEGATIGSSSDTRKTSRLSDFYLFRNRLKFTARFFPHALPSVWFVMLLQAFRRGLRGQSDRMWMIFQILLGRNTP